MMSQDIILVALGNAASVRNLVLNLLYLRPCPPYRPTQRSRQQGKRDSKMASIAAVWSIGSGVSGSPMGRRPTELSNIAMLKRELASSKLLKHQSYLVKRRTPNSKLSCAVSAEYNGRRGGSSDFLAGFILGGAVFGALGYLLAPVVSKSLSELENRFEEGIPQKQPKYLEDDEGLERTRKNLNEKIAQLNAAIDNVSAQLRAEETLSATGENPAEFETAV